MSAETNARLGWAAAAAFAYPGEGYYQASDVTAQVAAGKPLAIGVIYHWYGSGQGRPAGERGLLLGQYRR